MFFRITKIFFVISLLVLVIFFGGAYLMPDRQYYARNLVINTDPVAVYSKLKNTEMIQKISPGIFSNQDFSFRIDSMQEFQSIQYGIFENDKRIIKAGFLLEEVETGTELTWYMELDSLSFPYERWKGFFTVLLKQSSFINSDEKIIDEIIN